jgi:hypothetical protein
VGCVLDPPHHLSRHYATAGTHVQRAEYLATRTITDVSHVGTLLYRDVRLLDARLRQHWQVSLALVVPKDQSIHLTPH